MSEEAKPAPTSPTACPVCSSPETATLLVTCRELGKEQDVRVCSACGYVRMPGNTHDYASATSAAAFDHAHRCGTDDREGREYGMARLGVETLGGSGLSVLIYGVGRSMDNLHIAKLPEVDRAVIGDIVRVRDDAAFVDISGHATDEFDIVVASEVIEHFTDPRLDFEKLFSWVTEEGILICSTNIHDGGTLNNRRYIFGRGHVSYYSPRSLRVIAKQLGWHVDFRLPLAVVGRAGPRKRYVIFSRSRDVMDRVSEYFGSHPYAPSEEPTHAPHRKSKSQPLRQVVNGAAATDGGARSERGRSSQRPTASQTALAIVRRFRDRGDRHSRIRS